MLSAAQMVEADSLELRILGQQLIEGHGVIKCAALCATLLPLTKFAA